MNYNSILQLLDNGYSAEDILITLKNASPKIAKKIQKYITGGLSIPEVLKGLIQDPSIKQVDISKSRGSSPSEVQALSLMQKYNSVPESRDKEALQYLQKFTRQAINIGSLAGGAYALSRAIPKAVQALPQSFLGSIPQASQLEKIENQASQFPVVKPNITQTQFQPEVKTIDIGSLLEKSGLKKHVDELSQRIKDPKQIAALLYNKYPKEMKEFQAASGKNMEDALGDYLNSNPVQSGANPAQSKTSEKLSEEDIKEAFEPEGSQPIKGMRDNFNSENQWTPIEIQRELKVPYAQAKKIAEERNSKSSENKQKPTKIDKSSIVASPNGIGEVKSIRNGQALIDINGKLHKVKEEELIQSPLPEKDLADLYNDVISGIEKESGQQVSRNVYWAGYDPNTNELAYLPHDGGLYIYDDISPDDANELTNILSQRKSTGQNYIGAWHKGTKSPIGSQMYQLIQRLQKERGGKGNEYANKFQKVYDALEIAKIAAKKKYEERNKKAKKPRVD